MSPQRYTMFCCDCGLAHQFQFRIGKDRKGRDRVQFRVKRADLYTQMHRKRKATKGEVDVLKKGEAVVATIDGAMVITLQNGLRRGGVKHRPPKTKARKGKRHGH